MTARHNEFITDSNNMITSILQSVPNEYHNNIIMLYNNHIGKWKNVYTQKKEETIDETINNDRKRISNLYNELKEGIYYQQNVINNNVNMSSSLPEVIERIRSIIEYEKKTKSHLNEIQYKKGLTLSLLKTLTITTKSFKKALKNIMSYAHACKLISFYNTCEKYHNLRFTTLPFNKIYSNLHSLEEFMKTEPQFWNPPQQTV